MRDVDVKIHRRWWRTLLKFDGGNRRPIPSLDFDDWPMIAVGNRCPLLILMHEQSQ